ncbi:MAG: GNAT family N-acetyltransferase [Clostridiales bacterium]|jgi:predicted acetyltransferase|nr:GNAT family N-acetyltransferase [Clostridiales bacterium]
MQKLKFILPSAEMKPAFEAFKRAFAERGEKVKAGMINPNITDFPEWLESLRRDKSTTWFVFRQPDNKLVGIVNIRNTLNADGHITCSIRPDERGSGYGTETLRLALDRARELGVVEAEILCPPGNAAARRIIRRNGLEKTDNNIYRKIL